MTRRYLILGIALACFLALVGILVANSYLGVYDTIYMTTDELEQMIDSDFWYRFRHQPTAHAEWDTKTFFTYEVDNRQFSAYSTTIQASLWKDSEKIMELAAEDKTIAPFSKATLECVIDPSELESMGFSPGEYTVLLEREGVERAILLVYSAPSMPSSPRIPTHPLANEDDS